MIIEKRNTVALLLSTIVISTLLVLWHFRSYSEPPFVVIGSKEVLEKIHFNVFMFRYESESYLNTVFLNGKSYVSDNKDVDRFEFYISYDNKLFGHFGYDNVPRMMNDASIARNTLFFCRLGSDILFSNQSTKCEEQKSTIKLRPLGDQIDFDLNNAKRNGSIKTHADEELFINNAKSMFYQISRPVR